MIYEVKFETEADKPDRAVMDYLSQKEKSFVVTEKETGKEYIVKVQDVELVTFEG